VLRRGVGDAFDCGLVNGPRGRATLVAADAAALTLAFAWEAAPPPSPAPLTLIVGLPRPQTARDILRDATTLGVAALHFVATEKGEPSYAHSSLWTTGEWRRHLRDGAQQAFDTRVPDVTHGRALADVLGELGKNSARLALDNYEAGAPLAAALPLAGSPLTLAVGGERGWSAADRAALRAHGFALVHLGPRVLRTETACVAALTLAHARPAVSGGKNSPSAGARPCLGA
jgi:16S rRNA (uracil1498-N3)-methyltransferase